MTSILYFIAPAAIISILIVCYIGLKGLNDQLNKDLAAKESKFSDSPISDFNKDQIILELIEKVKVLTYAQLKNQREIEKLVLGSPIPVNVLLKLLKNVSATSHDPYSSDHNKLTSNNIVIKPVSGNKFREYSLS